MAFPGKVPSPPAGEGDDAGVLNREHTVMTKKRLVLAFHSTLVDQPVVYHLVKDYDLQVNILRRRNTDIAPLHRPSAVVSSIRLSITCGCFSSGMNSKTRVM